MDRVPLDARLFLGMLAALVPFQVAHTAQVRTMYTDGGYYAEVARHVRDGQGLVSDVSLYQFGYERFPFPTSVYPLWPWILGLLSRVAPLELLAHWLPLALSFVAITLAFLLGRRLAPEPLFPDRLPGVHAGHVLALTLGLQADFVFFASLPYTEPLAWTLLLGFALRWTGKQADLGWPWAVEIGAWLGLMYLARFQLVIAMIAVAGVYAIRVAVGPRRLRVAAHGATALGLGGAVLGAWFLRIRTFVLDAGVGSLLRFDQNRANGLLHPLDVIVDTPGPWATVLDRAHGVLVAWDPGSRFSYAESFFTLHWALAAAVPFLVVAGVREVRREGIHALVDRLRRPDAVPWSFLVLVAIGGLLSVHAVHKHFNGEWYFANRQGLIALPAFALALIWLLRQRGPAPFALGVLVASSSLVLGARDLWLQVVDLPTELKDDENHVLWAWLDQHRAPDGRLVVALDYEVQRLAWRTEGIGYHWVFAETPYEDYLTLGDRLGVEYVILKNKGLARWEFLDDPVRLDRDFEQVLDAPATHLVYRRRR